MIASNPEIAEAGSRIGPYRVISQLGAGGMGRVYLAASPSGRAVAVKVVRAELASDPEFRRRFAAEVAAARAVSGAFTTPVVDADPDGAQPWLAIAYVSGPSLQSAVDEHGPMPEPTLRILGAGLAEALGAIHNAGLIHRDLKPSNILLATDGPRVIDFGISKAMDATSATLDGQIIGSAGYMSPEHAAGAALTPASDVFSLGAVLTFAATGRPPFGTGPMQVLMFRAAHEQPRLDGVPPELLGLIAACLDKDPGRRPPTGYLPGWLRPGPVAVGWLGAVADQVAQHERTVAKAVRRPVLSRRGVLIGGGLALAAAAGGAALLLRSRSNASVPQLSWTSNVPSADLWVTAADASTVVCVSQSSVASFDRAGGQPLWHGSVDSGATDIRTDGTRVYTVRTDGRLHGTDARTGRDVWASSASGSNAPKLELVAADTVVTMDDNGKFYGVNAATGDTRWSRQYPEGSGNSAQDATATGRVVLVGNSRTKSALNMLLGYTVVDLAHGTVAWTRDLVTLHLPPAGNVCYAIDNSMNLLGLDAATGHQLWQHSTTLPPTIAQTLFYENALDLQQDTVLARPIGSLGSDHETGVFAAFDATDGHPLWSINISGSEGLSYGVLGRTLCRVNNGMHGMDLRTGATLWTITNPGLEFLGTCGGMFISSYTDSTGQGGLAGWDPTSGNQVWRFPVTGGSGSWSALSVPGALFAGYSGKLYGFQLTNSA